MAPLKKLTAPLRPLPFKGRDRVGMGKYWLLRTTSTLRTGKNPNQSMVDTRKGYPYKNRNVGAPLAGAHI